MTLVLYSVASYGDRVCDELMLLLLDEASVVGSMEPTFSYNNDGIAPLFIVSTPYEVLV